MDLPLHMMTLLQKQQNEIMQLKKDKIALQKQVVKLQKLVIKNAKSDIERIANAQN
jgi:hypothetical protein